MFTTEPGSTTTSNSLAGLPLTVIQHEGLYFCATDSGPAFANEGAFMCPKGAPDVQKAELEQS